jgi:hypothetical protein
MEKRVAPTPEEFDVTPTSVMHRPTGALWTAYADSKFPNWFRPGQLGSVLANGDDYPADAVIEMGKTLLAQRPRL